MMILNKEVLKDLHKKYLTVSELIECKTDPENEPFQSKYAARVILMDMKEILEDLRKKESSGDSETLRLTAMYGAVLMNLAWNAIDTEELSVCGKHLEDCRNTVEEFEASPEVFIVALNMYNIFGILWSSREPEKAKMFLEKAQKLYNNFKESKKPPVDISHLFDQNIEQFDEETVLAVLNMEKVYTFTLFYLAQVFRKLNELFKSAVYCHITLQRELDMNDFDAIDWALNSATLSQFLIEKCAFKQARHHLAASSCILDKYELDKLISQTDDDDAEEQRNEENAAKIEIFKHRSADVARCWIKYGILLLGKSKNRLLADAENNKINEKCNDIVSELSKMNITENLNISQEDIQNLTFKGIDNIELHENEITDQFILQLSDAKKVFWKTVSYIEKAQDYYTLNTHASDYIEIVQDHVQLYLNFLFFDENPDNRAKLHKRRIDLFENLLTNINSKYYMNYCRQIWFELGLCYSEVIDIKCEKLRESQERPKPQALSKINNLVTKSINHYETYLNSFKINIADLEKIPEDEEHVYLQVCFYMSSMYRRYISLDKTVQLKNVEQQLKHYKFIVDYCEKYTKAQELIPMEFDVCKEMVMLLPVKILKLKELITS